KPATKDIAVAPGGSPSSNPPSSPSPAAVAKLAPSPTTGAAKAGASPVQVGASPGASPSPSPGAGGGRPIVLGGITFNDFGLADVKGETQFDMRVDNFSFQPTFLRGDVRQRLTLRITNPTSTPHNFSMSFSQEFQRIDQDIPPGGAIEVEVTFPGQQAARFFCKLHTGQGMNGELLAGNAEPQPAQ
ncbi:MAG TPA: hypothetical protein VHL09_02645, partial [Dehalococcoidia bacterium]|nr:hypothetical protein [Dehalococcoidia bacterium]